jgi:hypothetical protein
MSTSILRAFKRSKRFGKDKIAVFYNHAFVLLFVVLMSGDARAGQQDHEINKN